MTHPTHRSLIDHKVFSGDAVKSLALGLLLWLLWILITPAVATPNAADPVSGTTHPAGKTQRLTAPDQAPEGLSGSDWQSIRAAYEAGRHAFQPVADGWQARNPGQRWLTTFDRRGFEVQPRDGGWSWGLELQGYGFGEQPQPLGERPAATAAGQRLTYQWDGAVQEWYINDARGLEHGFTVQQRPPAGVTPTPLAFTLAVRGTLHPRIADDAQGVQFQDATGGTVLTYAGLKVWDADGQPLPARFEASGARELRLLVDERGARYPLTIDPLAQQAYLKASNTGADDNFGNSVAVAGDTVVVGAPLEDSNATGVDGDGTNNGASDAGAAYVFTRSGATWTQQAYLKASNTGASDQFGYSVAVAGDTLVVGARFEGSNATGVDGNQADNNALEAGAAYVFTRSGATWSQQAYLKASNTGGGDRFGTSVAVTGDTVVIGALGEASNATGGGAIRRTTAWALPVRPMCSRAAAPLGASKPISRPATPRGVTSSAPRWR